MAAEHATGGLLSHTLEFARRLQTIATVEDLVAATQQEVQARLGYSNSWVFVFEDETLATCRLWAISGWQTDAVRVHATRLSARDDAMIAEIVRTQRIVIVEDARTDPRTDKKIVEALGNRTIVNVPLRLLEQPLGVLGAGSFGDEGVRLPSAEALDYLVQIAGYLSVALSRIELIEQHAQREAERLRHERVLARTQRLESVGILAGGVAHDFNNLLTIILANAGLLERDGLADKQRQCLHVMVDAAERAADLCGRILALGRRSELRLETLDLNARAESLLLLLRRIVPADIEVELLSGGALPWVSGDAGQLDQVLMNLCLNARDAMSAGGKLTLETQHLVIDQAALRAMPWARPGRYVLLSVTDTGTGMPPEVVEHVFEPFFSTKEDGGGTGLGLAVAYSIVRQHGGMLQCHSELGRGTTFKLYLPALEAPPERVDTKLARTPRGAGETVLVAEDEEAVRELIVRQLESAGYEVCAVANGQQAIDQVAARAFDLVLLDVMMPNVGGREACERIRALRPTTRFLFASGYASEQARAELLSQARSELVPKPMHGDSLLRAVRRALGSSSPRR